MSDYIKYVARYPSGNEKAGILSIDGGCRTLVATEHKQPTSIVLPISIVTDSATAEENTMSQQESNRKVFPCLTPDRAEKRQNGRRFKDDGEPSFTLTAQDIHGVAISVSGNEVAESEQIAHCLNANDQRKVFGAKQDRTMVELHIKEATKQGYAVAHPGDSINLTMPNSQTRRGRVGGAVAQTLDTQCNQGTLEVIQGNGPSEDKKGIYVELSPTCHVYAVWYEKYQCYVAIRKLTPKECFRLQGWSDDYFEKAQFVNSDTQLYKQAGNGVTVNVVYEIGRLINSSEE